MLLGIYRLKRVFCFRPHYQHTTNTFAHTHTYTQVCSTLASMEWVFIYFFQFECSRFSLDYQTLPPQPPAGHKGSVGAAPAGDNKPSGMSFILWLENSCCFFILYFRYIFYFFLFWFFFQYYRSSNRNIFNSLKNPSYISSDDNIIILSKLVFLEFLSIFLK